MEAPSARLGVIIFRQSRTRIQRERLPLDVFQTERDTLRKLPGLMLTEPTLLRVEWTLDVVRACQHAVGELLEADPRHSHLSVCALAGRLTDPSSPAERLFLHDRLRAFGSSASRYVYQTWRLAWDTDSSDTARTTDRGATWRESDWNDRTADPRRMLVSWAEEYRQTLEREHRRSPALVVALRLQREFDAPHTIDLLAKDAACSRSALLRQFKGRFSVSLGAYLTIVRVRAAFHMLRQPDGKVEAIALAVGYRSPKNLYAALRRVAGMRPDQIRRLDASEAGAMLNGCLALPEPRAKRPLDRGYTSQSVTASRSEVSGSRVGTNSCAT